MFNPFHPIKALKDITRGAVGVGAAGVGAGDGNVMQKLRDLMLARQQPIQQPAQGSMLSRMAPMAGGGFMGGLGGPRPVPTPGSYDEAVMNGSGGMVFHPPNQPMQIEQADGGMPTEQPQPPQADAGWAGGAIGAAASALGGGVKRPGMKKPGMDEQDQNNAY